MILMICNYNGNEVNELHSSNILFILITLEVFHFEISGNDNNDLHL